MRLIVSHPCVWKDYDLKVKMVDDDGQFVISPSQFFDAHFFHDLPVRIEIDMTMAEGDFFQLGSFFKGLYSKYGRNYCLRLEIHPLLLEKLGCSLVANAIASVKECSIHKPFDGAATKFSSQLYEIICARLDECNTLQKVSFYDSVDLSSIDPESFGACFSRLQCVTLYETGLTTQHLNKLFEYTAHSHMIKEFRCDAHLSEVDEDLLAEAMGGMHAVQLYDSGLRKGHIVSLMKCVIRCQSIRKLDLTDNDLSQVDP